MGTALSLAPRHNSGPSGSSPAALLCPGAFQQRACGLHGRDTRETGALLGFTKKRPLKHREPAIHPSIYSITLQNTPEQKSSHRSTFNIYTPCYWHSLQPRRNPTGQMKPERGSLRKGEAFLRENVLRVPLRAEPDHFFSPDPTGVPAARELAVVQAGSRADVLQQHLARFGPSDAAMAICGVPHLETNTFLTKPCQSK